MQGLVVERTMLAVVRSAFIRVTERFRRSIPTALAVKVGNRGLLGFEECQLNRTEVSGT